MNLYADLRWPAFAERYASDLNAFARDVCSIDLGERMTDAAGAVGRRLVIHNAGTRERQGVVLAVMALWHIATHPQSTTVLGYPLGSACQANQAIGQLLAHIRTGSHYWLARGIKHRAGGWFAGGGLRSTIELRRLTTKDTEAAHGFYLESLLWLVEDGDRLPGACLEAILSTMTRPGNGLAVACDWYVPRSLMSMVRARSATPWSLVDMGQSARPAPAQQHERYQVEVREFIELVAGRPLTRLQADYLADLLQERPAAQTPA
ncbi:hypothetical protein [Pseudomonas sp. GD03730]|uniref:hypothetical protein n=1 Tax=Pseudomonas sp. GD03730 TaxID=2975375 RepID=UPI002447355C|nr:hypothetical protein [Pseudomonas sp. GD03730]MDH1403728.1 hypothetical protein [Pseudomonas sp. GD03730]